MVEQLSTAIGAVDRLNSWVRSPKRRGEAHRPVGPVYYFKRRALLAAESAGLVDAVRFVRTTVSCRTCGGSGEYFGWWAECSSDGEPCRRCSATGSVELQFCETEIAGVRWHTPRDRWPLSETHSVPTDPSEWETASDWQPNAEGRPLEPWEVAAALNVVEPAFPPERLPRYYSAEAGAAYGHFKHELYVGETDPRRCAFCHRPARLGTHVVSRGRVAWGDHVCKQCDGEFDRSSAVIFSRFPFPVYLTTHPEIRAWMGRNAPELAALTGDVDRSYEVQNAG